MTACQNLAIDNNAYYFGMKSMNLCVFGPQTDVFDKNGVSSNCSAQCGNAYQTGSYPTCGSSNAIDMYSIGSINPLSAISVNNQYLYRGCFIDGANRVLPTFYALIGNNYVKECSMNAKSTNADFFGLENGNQCFTGMISEILTKNGPIQLESLCNYDCNDLSTAGGAGVKCGNANAISNVVV